MKQKFSKKEASPEIGQLAYFNNQKIFTRLKAKNIFHTYKSVLRIYFLSFFEYIQIRIYISIYIICMIQMSAQSKQREILFFSYIYSIESRIVSIKSEAVVSMWVTIDGSIYLYIGRSGRGCVRPLTYTHRISYEHCKSFIFDLDIYI